MLAAIAQGPGSLEAYINRRKLSRRQPHVEAIRTSVVSAVEATLPSGHAQVRTNAGALI
jgi:hypothetical protein